MKRLLLVTLLTLAMVAQSHAMDEYPPLKPPEKISYKDLRSLGIALSLLEYVDLQKRDPSVFLYAALAGMMEGFDRYSYFVSPDLVDVFLNDLKDEYVGIGLHIARTQDGNAEIVSVESGSPAEKAGLEPKDIIMDLDGIPLKTMRFTNIVRIVRGPGKAPGTEVRILLRKTAGRNEIELTLARDSIRIKTVESRPVHGAVGYVRIHRFTRATPGDLEREITKLRQDGRMEKGLILDLRNNPGGEMLATVDVARLFLDNGVITSMESNYPLWNVTFRTNGPSLIKDPLVVLIDEGSASGAELVAGAIKVYGRGTLIGRKTFGKGSFQSFVPITNEIGAYLTLGRFKLPDGISPEGSGIVPDMPLESTSDRDDAIKKAVSILENQPARRE